MKLSIFAKPSSLNLFSELFTVLFKTLRQNVFINDTSFTYTLSKN